MRSGLSVRVCVRVQVENDLGPAVFPNAMIVGDCIITDLLGIVCVYVNEHNVVGYEHNVVGYHRPPWYCVCICQ
jgi:hypothetical protein